MRVTQLMIPLLVVLAAAGCARQQQAAYVIDPSTGQPVPVVQQYSPQQYGYAQAGYQANYPAYAQAAPQPAVRFDLEQRPIIVAVAGPNGAGKSTFYSAHLRPA